MIERKIGNALEHFSVDALYEPQSLRSKSSRQLVTVCVVVVVVLFGYFIANSR